MNEPVLQEKSLSYQIRIERSLVFECLQFESGTATQGCLVRDAFGPFETTVDAFLIKHTENEIIVNGLPFNYRDLNCSKIEHTDECLFTRDIVRFTMEHSFELCHAHSIYLKSLENPSN